MPEQFWDLTYREFTLMQIGYMERLKEQHIHNWDLLRNMAVFVLSPHLKKGKNIKPKDIMRLPIDSSNEKIESVAKLRQEALFKAKKFEAIKAKQTKEKKEGKKFKSIF